MANPPRRKLEVALALLLALPAVGVVAADHPADHEFAPLPEVERRQITTDLLKQYPDLAGSPGIKFAEAPVDRDGRVGITVTFYPHAESRGVKDAYQANCAWESSAGTWSCFEVVVRRYLVLSSQNFEVRLYSDLSGDAALALIERSRRELHAAVPNGPSRPDTAIMIRHKGDAHRIAWGNERGNSWLDMEVELSPGGDPANPDDWQARIL